MRNLMMLLAGLLLAATPALAQTSYPSPAYWQGTQTSGDGAMFFDSGKGATIQDASTGTPKFPLGIQFGNIAYSGLPGPGNANLWSAPSATGSCTQTNAGNGPLDNCALNRLRYYPDTVQSPNNRSTVGLDVDLFPGAGGGTWSGGRVGILGFVFVQGASTNGPGTFYTAGAFQSQASVNDGGTAGAVQSSVFGVNSIVSLGPSATYWSSMVGEEIDLTANAGSSVSSKIGLQVVSTPGDAVQASLQSMAFAITQSGNGFSTYPGFLMGISFGQQAGYSAMPPSSTLIGVTCHTGNCSSFPPGTVTEGVDFSAYGFSDCAFKSTAFCVDGTGKVTGLSFVSATYAGANTATTLGTVNGPAIRVIDSGAAPINWLQVTPGQTGQGVGLVCGGPSSDTNVGCSLSSKGTGTLGLNVGNSKVIQMTAAAGAVNFIQVNAGLTGVPVVFQASGTDPNINIEFVPKGTGVLQIGATLGVTCSGTPTASFASTGGLVTHC
jgi:hypothetical protein